MTALAETGCRQPAEECWKVLGEHAGYTRVSTGHRKCFLALRGCCAGEEEEVECGSGESRSRTEGLLSQPPAPDTARSTHNIAHRNDRNAQERVLRSGRELYWHNLHSKIDFVEYVRGISISTVQIGPSHLTKEVSGPAHIFTQLNSGCAIR